MKAQKNGFLSLKKERQKEKYLGNFVSNSVHVIKWPKTKEKGLLQD